MRIKGSYPLLIFGLLLLAVSPAWAQGVIDRNHVPSTERTDAFERRSDNIDGNNIRATITNWAQTANSGNPGDFWYELPKNTGRVYVALSAQLRATAFDPGFYVRPENYREPRRVQLGVEVRF